MASSKPVMLVLEGTMGLQMAKPGVKADGQLPVAVDRGVDGPSYDGFDLAHIRPYILTGSVLQALTRP